MYSHVNYVEMVEIVPHNATITMMSALNNPDYITSHRSGQSLSPAPPDTRAPDTCLTLDPGSTTPLNSMTSTTLSWGS